MIESMNGGGGAFLNLMGDLAYKALDKLVDNSQQWDFMSCRDKSARNPKKCIFQFNYVTKLCLIVLKWDIHCVLSDKYIASFDLL
jgi:hypothetical protein